MDISTLKETLKTIKYPGFSRDIVSFGLIQNIDLADGHASIQIGVTTSDPKVPKQIKDEVEAKIGELDGIESVNVELVVNAPKGGSSSSGSGGKASGLQGVKYVIAVASGKGGVGKSTLAVNLACALDRVLSEKGKHDGVGILDCDIYGPSVPLMLGVASRPEIRDEKIIPPANFGIRCMSMGLLVDEDAPVVWRGPMINQAINQFADSVQWAPMEILVVDLPPGTGDAQLSLVQTMPVDGAVIITTPQAAAFNVARRGARMFAKVNVPILGVAENMSFLDLPGGGRQYLFGKGGGRTVAEALETELLGEIPLDPMIREGGDRGIPMIVSQPDSPAGTVILDVARKLITNLQNA